MKRIEVAAAIIHDNQGRIFCTQRGYGDWLPTDLSILNLLWGADAWTKGNGYDPNSFFSSSMSGNAFRMFSGISSAVL